MFLCSPMYPPLPQPTNSRKRKKEDRDREQAERLGQEKEVSVPTYIGFEVTGCRMTWGAWVGVSGTGTTSESHRVDSQ